MSRIGNRKIEVPEGVTVKVENDVVTVTGPKGSLSQKMLKGISLEQEGNTITLTRVNDGYSHPVVMDVPEGLTVEAPSNTEIVVKGIDKVLVGEFAANVRKVRKPEPYKGKGIRYKDEHIQRKEGKKAA